MSMVSRYLYNIALSVDQFLNTVFGGDPDETVSSRIGKCKARHGGEIPWSHPVARILDKALDAVDPGHSVDSIDTGEGSDAVIGTCDTVECLGCRAVHPSPLVERRMDHSALVLKCPACGRTAWHKYHRHNGKGGLSKRKDTASTLFNQLKFS